MSDENGKLRRMAHHIAHDVRMLGRAFDRHLIDPFAYTAWFVHCRSVMDFFGTTRRHPDDIHASDYLSAESWEEIRGTTDEPCQFQDVRKAVNALAAHPSRKRLKYEAGGERANQGRPDEAVTNYLVALAQLFVANLDPKQRAWFGGIWR